MIRFGFSAVGPVSVRFFVRFGSVLVRFLCDSVQIRFKYAFEPDLNRIADALGFQLFRPQKVKIYSKIILGIPSFVLTFVNL